MCGYRSGAAAGAVLALGSCATKRPVLCHVRYSSARCWCCCSALHALSILVRRQLTGCLCLVHLQMQLLLGSISTFSK